MNRVPIDPEKVERVHRITYPSASFTLTNSLIAWIAAESRRRNVSKSVLVREILDSARAESERSAESVAA